MHRKLVVNAFDPETRVALLEDGNIVELFIERNDSGDIAGNIYKGRVQRVLPGMQAAFIDIGLQQAAFLHVSDVIGNTPEENTRSANPPDASHGEGADAPRDNDFRHIRRQVPIEALLIEGQEIMVHVAKSPLGTKGARVTSHVSLPGRFLVLMPTSRHIGVSRRIENEEERARLRQMVAELRGEECGYIVRTAAEGVGIEKIEGEMKLLDKMWENIRTRYRTAPVPSLVHKELDITLRAVRDLLLSEAETLVVDDPASHREVNAFLDTCAPALKGCVELYRGYEPIFDAFNLEGDISRALKRKVWLKSGGYIVIDQTEALVAIDVNTGRYVGKHNLEETILKTNLEAVKEIAYQIRLRDIGGIIIVDFIDMEKKSSRDKVFEAFKNAVKRDRSKTHILPFSEMGLIQMTRKRIREPITRLLCEPCFYCDGEGYLVSRKSICLNIVRDILRQSQDMIGHGIMLRVNPEIAEMLHGEESAVISALETRLGRQIVIYPNPRYHLEEFELFETTQAPPPRRETARTTPATADSETRLEGGE